jgi:hypothetical protein
MINIGWNDDKNKNSIVMPKWKLEIQREMSNRK